MTRSPMSAAGFRFAATPANNAAQSSALKLALADMRWGDSIERTAWARFHATHGRSPTNDEWVDLKPTLFEHYGPPCPVEVRLQRPFAMSDPKARKAA